MTGPSSLLVVTPTLGTSEYLDQAVASVRVAAAAATHVLCCPAGRVEELRGRYPQSLVLPDAGREGGIYGAINFALRDAPPGWEWFTYINDDDILSPRFAEMFRAHVSRQKPEQVAYGDVLRIGEKGQSLGLITTESEPRRLPAVLRQGISPLNQQGMIFHREVAAALGGLDFKNFWLCADLDYWVRAFAAGYAFRYYPMEVGQFRIRSGQLSSDIGKVRGEITEIVRRHLPGASPSRLEGWLARWGYRARNLPRYLGRIRMTGFARSETVLGGNR